MITPKEIQRRLEKAELALQGTYEAIGKEVYHAYVVPFCDQWGLRFVSGMGTWCFWDTSGEQVMEDNHSDMWQGTRLRKLREVSEILKMDCMGNTIGEYVPDYDWRSK